MEAEIPSMQDRAHLAFEKEHYGAWAVVCVHEHDRNAVLFVDVNENPMFFVHFQIYDEIGQSRKSVDNKLLAD